MKIIMFNTFRGLVSFLMTSFLLLELESSYVSCWTTSKNSGFGNPKLNIVHQPIKCSIQQTRGKELLSNVNDRSMFVLQSVLGRDEREDIMRTSTNDDNDDNNDNNSRTTTPTPVAKPILSSRYPQKLERGVFLGFQTLQKKSSTTQLKSTETATLLDASETLSPCVIRVLGVGGGGCNAVDRMLESASADGIGTSIEYWAINTDAQALGRSKALGANILNIGTSVTGGLGAGGDPRVGCQAALESTADLTKMLEGTDLCFITAGMGGGTGSGAAPVVSEISKENGALTVAIVTKPFGFEGRRRMKQATEAIDKLRQHVDTVIVVSNNKLLEIIPDDTPVTAAFRVADDILRQGVVGISEIIVRPGLINVDFADVRSIMKDAGSALMGIGTGTGKSGAEDAAIAAISSPLLDEPIQDATGVVFNIMGPPGLSLQEVNRAARVIYDNVHEDANVIFGALVDEDMKEEVSITVLATGFGTPTDSMQQ